MDSLVVDFLKQGWLTEAIDRLDDSKSYIEIKSRYRRNKRAHSLWLLSNKEWEAIQSEIVRDILYPLPFILSDNAKNLYEKGRHYFYKRRYKSAKNYFLNCIEEVEKTGNIYPDAHHYLALVFHKKREFGLAVIHFRITIENNPLDPDFAYHCLSISYLRVGDKVRSLDCIEKINKKEKFVKLDKLITEIKKLP